MVLSANDGGQSTVRSQVFDQMNTSITWPSYFDGRALRNATSVDWEAGESTEENRSRYQQALRGADKGYGDTDQRSSVWCGTAVGLINEVEPAAQIVAHIRASAQKLIGGLAYRL